MNRETRERVEDGLREDRRRCVACTSTLDLGGTSCGSTGWLQVGSPKASVGASSGRAGAVMSRAPSSRLTCVPTNALELVDVAAAPATLEARPDRGAPAGRAAARSSGGPRGDNPRWGSSSGPRKPSDEAVVLPGRMSDLPGGRLVLAPRLHHQGREWCQSVSETQAGGSAHRRSAWLEAGRREEEIALDRVRSLASRR